VLRVWQASMPIAAKTRIRQKSLSFQSRSMEEVAERISVVAVHSVPIAIISR
jgi:hypothetical protein